MIQLFRSDEIQCILGGDGLIGTGSYGSVRIGFHKIHGVVAVKCSEMQDEIKIMNTVEKKIKSEIEMIQRAQHENIVRVYGWTQWPGAIAIVMEYLPGGNLMEVLDDPDVPLEPLLRLRMGYEIANGIAFIHNLSPDNNIVHGDIKPENILLTENLHCKLSDFGGARLFVYTEGSTSANSRQYTNQFTELYASPDTLQDPSSKMRPPHDIYSFSMTMYALIGREFPIHSEWQLNIYLDKVKRGYRPDIGVIDDSIQELQDKGRANDINVIMTMKNLMEKCWSQNPSNRPLMVDVKTELHNLLAKQDFVKIQEYAVNAAREINIQKVSHDQHKWVQLNQFLPPYFNSIGAEDVSQTSDGEESAYNENPVSAAKLDIAKSSIAPAIESEIATQLSEDKQSISENKDVSPATFKIAKSSSDTLSSDVVGRMLIKMPQFSYLTIVISIIVCIIAIIIWRHPLTSTSYDNNSHGFLAIKSQEVYFYNITTMQLHHLQNLTFDHSSGSAVSFNGEVFVISGYKINSVEKIKSDNLSSGWIEVASTNQRRDMAASSACGDYLYSVGGRLPSTSSGERYDFHSKEWNRIENMNQKRRSHGLISLKGKVCAIGGYDEGIWLNSAECYDPLSDKWTMIPSMETKRAGLSAVVLNNEIYAIGGYNGDKGYLASVERYNPEKRKWYDANLLNQPRSGHGSCVINKKIYVAGGSIFMRDHDTIEVYNPVKDVWEVEAEFDELKRSEIVVLV